MKKAFFLMCCLIFSQWVMADFTLKLLDKVTTMPVAFATVEYKWVDPNSKRNINMLAKTDAKGVCSIAEEAIKNLAVFHIKHITYGDLSFSTFELIKANYILYLQPQQVDLNQSVITANKEITPVKNISRHVEVINRNQIAFSSAQNTADLVFNESGAYIQKSQQGGGSVILRGFEANRILLMVDGVRMNNAIFRAGHLQNILRVDQFILDRVEILYGPGSVSYGSDAIGGVVQLFSRNPILIQENTQPNKKLLVKSEGVFRHSTANNEFTKHLNINLAGKKWGILTGITQSDFGNVIMGKNRSSAWENVGLRPYFVKRLNGKDVLVNNPNKYEQAESHYQQTDVFAKLLFKPKNNTEHLFNIQYSFTNNVPRYDRLSEPFDEMLRFAEWYYGPEKRLLASYQFNKSNLNRKFADAIKNTVAYQFVEESRYDRRFGQDFRNSRIEQLHIWSHSFIASKWIGAHQFNYGSDVQFNDVQSNAFRFNIVNGERTALSTRYPEGGSQMLNSGVFIHHQYQKNKWIWNESVRYSFVHTQANFGESKNFYNFLPNSTQQTNHALNGSLGLIYLVNSTNRIYVNLSNAFRAPNLDDLNKLFDSRSGFVIVPNPELKPEKSVTGEIGTNLSFKQIVKLNTAIYYTQLYEAIVVNASSRNGSDSIFFGGAMSRINTLENTRNAFVYGNNTSLQIIINPNIHMYGDVNYTFGRIVENNNQTPLDHIPPLYGKAGVRFMFKHVQLDAFMRGSGAKQLSEYNLEGEDNLEYATSNGLPAWQTYNIKAQYNYYRKGTLFTLQGGIENILDTHYRLFASGISAPGRNFYLSLKISL